MVLYDVTVRGAGGGAHTSSGVLTCASCILTSYFILFVLVTRAELRQDVIA